MGVADAWLLFSLSFAAFAVACCKRSESDFKRAASGVDWGLTVVCSGFFEQPVVERTKAAKTTSEKFFMSERV